MKKRKIQLLSTDSFRKCTKFLPLILLLLWCSGCKKTGDFLNHLNDPNAVSCLERANFGDPAESEYILPYPPGARYKMDQGYCYRNGGHINQLSYDFTMPIGSQIIAVREGIVWEVKEDSSDDGFGEGRHNYVLIEHPDGTIAFYAHLKKNGVEVQVGDPVATGQFIAYSGNSGLTNGPHLHFGVYQYKPLRDGYDVPINFRNTDGPLDSRGGLVLYQYYTALEF